MICIRSAFNASGRSDARKLNLEAHKAFLRSLPFKILLSGPIHDADGQQAGAFVVAEAPDLAALEATCAGDPFLTEGVYDRVSYYEWRPTLGSLLPSGS